MKEQLISAIEEIRSDGQIGNYNETETRQYIILRILKELGWNTYSRTEVQPEYSMSEGFVDYCIHYDRTSKLFVEVKQTGINLQNHQAQLLKYSISEGGKLALLTNGIEWWFYLPLKANASFDRKRFTIIDIKKLSSKNSAEEFHKYLSKESVVSGSAVELAEKVYENNLIHQRIKEALPLAWKKIISEPDEMLVDMIAEATEEICGFKPDASVVEKFILDLFQVIRKQTPKKTTHSTTSKQNKQKTSAGITGQSFTKTKPYSFIFLGEKYEINRWRQLLLKICGIMFEKHKSNFNTVLTILKKNGSPYFSYNPDDLKDGLEIKGSGIFVEGWFNANNIVKMTMRTLKHFNYSENDIELFYN